MKYLKLPSLYILLPFLLFAFFFNLTHIPIRIWDEARNAVNAMELLDSSNWLVPGFEGSPDMWNTKPPLLIWIQAILMKLIGINELAVRLPAALSAIATGILIWHYLHKWLNQQWAGMLAAIILATTPAYIANHAGRTGDYDALLVFFMTAYSFQVFAYTISGNQKSFRWFWVFSALAVMTKGIAGFMFWPGLLLFVILEQKFRMVLRSRDFWIGAAGFIIVIAGYYLGREIFNPGYLQAVYENELGGRFLQTLEMHEHPFGYYWNNLFELTYTYWIWFVFPAFIIGFVSERLIRKITVFNLLIAVSFFLIISAGATKLEWYALPVYPFLAIQIAISLYRLLQLVQIRWKPASLSAVCLILFIIIFFKPVKNTVRSVVHFEEKPWDVEPHQPAWFLKHSVDRGELLNAHTILYEGYYGHLLFYIDRLRKKGSDIDLEAEAAPVRPGRFLVANQDVLIKELKDNFSIDSIGSHSGCTLFYVRSEK